MGTTNETTHLRRRAIARALANGGAATVTRVRFGSYHVTSATRPGRQHTVSVGAQGQYWCSCEAGLSGRPCWHAAAVYVAKVEHASKGRVSGPSTARLAPPANVVALQSRRAA